MKDRVYKGSTIERDIHGYYTATVEDGIYTYSLIPFKADTLKGIKRLIKEYHQKMNDRDTMNRRMIGEIK